MKETAETHAMNTEHAVFAVLSCEQGALCLVWSCRDCEVRGTDTFEDDDA